MLCSTIIVNWNASAVLGDCLDSVLSQRLPREHEVIVVDNASTDRSPEVLAAYADRVRVVANAANLGFAAANNQGARLARGDFLFLLNPDTRLVGPGVLARLVRELDDPRVGLVGPRLLNADGSLQGSCASLPGLSSAAVLAVGAHRLLPDRLRARLTPVVWSHRRSIDTGWLRGAALVMRRAVFERVGGFCEDTFMYGEDLDLGYRVARAGLRVRFAADAEVVHHDDHSASQRWTPSQRARRVGRGELSFMSRNYRPLHAWAVRLVVGAGYAARAAAFRLLRAPRKAEVYGALAAVYLWRGAS